MGGLCLDPSRLDRGRSGGFRQRIGGHDPVLLVPLRLVERLVGCSDQLLGSLEGALDGNPEAGGDRELFAVGELDRRRLEITPKPVGELRRAEQVGLWREQAELLAAETRGEVGVAAPGIEDRGNTPENGVAGLMAAAVVDALEVVEIDEDERL